MTILEIQTALNKQGFNPGDVDGVWGRRTMLAVKAFQQARGLKPDGVVGPLTLRALTGSTGAAAADGEVAPLVWYEEALNLVGTTEDKSVRSNPEILKWAKDLDIDYKDDDIP
jgi:peptidoglycan hydrolase-like protein with peptidoglycan-binding domain